MRSKKEDGKLYLKHNNTLITMETVLAKFEQIHISLMVFLYIKSQSEMLQAIRVIDFYHLKLLEKQLTLQI